MVVIVDTSSLCSLVRYYLPLDKEGQLISFIKRSLINRQMIIIDKVYEECRRLAQGEIINRMPFLKDKVFADLIFNIDQDSVVPPPKFLNIVNEGFVVKAKFNELNEGQKQAQIERFFDGADYALLLCSYINKKKIDGGLFPEDILILTEESNASNDNKCFKKIPLCSKIIDVDTIGLTNYLLKETDGNLRLLIEAQV